MMHPTITGDETFTRFRRKLEDAVTVAINSGQVTLLSVTKSERTHCPMGCLPEANFRNGTPPAMSACTAWEIEKHQALAFQIGFDGEPYTDFGGDSLAYFRLGQLYRARFP